MTPINEKKLYKKKTKINYFCLSRKNINMLIISKKTAKAKKKLEHLMNTRKEELKKMNPTTKKYKNCAEQLTIYKNLYNTLN